MQGKVFPNRTCRRVADLVMLAIAVSACGGGDVADPVAGTIVEPAAPIAEPDTAPRTDASPTSVRAAAEDAADAGNADPGNGDGDMAQLEQAWSRSRDRMVAALAVPDNGVDDGVLRGPGGFEVDLGLCPDAWRDTAGLDDETIRVAAVAAKSGRHAAFGDLTVGMQLYFDYVNESGGIDGRTIELVVHDDRYEPTEAVAAVTDLIGAEDPFLVTTVGSPTSLAVYDDLNTACVPHPFVASGHPAWGDPVAHPFTTGLQLSRSTEAILWGQWIKDHLPGLVPVTVGALVIDNDFGDVYADSFQAWAEANPDIVSDFVTVRHDPASRLVAAEMAQLAEAEPDVFLSMTAGEPCVSAVTEARRSGLADTAAGMFTPSGCQQPNAFLAPAGDAGHGFWIVAGGMKSLDDPAFTDEAFVAFANARLHAAGIDPDRHLVGVGFAQYGWAHVELLRVAATLPGGLTRSNVVLASRGLDLEHPMLLSGVRFATDGARDAFPIEGSVYSRYDADSAAWYVQGSAVDLNGGSPNCELVDLTCRQ